MKAENFFDKTVNNEKNFATRIKQINSKSVKRIQNPNIEEWKKRQKEIINDLIREEALKHFEWAARIGELHSDSWIGNPEFSCWGEDPKNIPHAEKLTRELAEEICKPYEITVTRVYLTMDDARINIELKIE